MHVSDSKPLGINLDTGESFNIMLIDDSNIFRMTLKQILMSEDFKIILESPSGEDAIFVLKETSEKPEYYFVDYEMPGMNGFETIKEIKKIHPSAKIIMITSISDKKKVMDLMKLGIMGYIVKPIDRETILRRISKLFGRQRYIT